VLLPFHGVGAIVAVVVDEEVKGIGAGVDMGTDEAGASRAGKRMTLLAIPLKQTLQRLLLRRLLLQHQ
jgi:hypothetical protein